jgi:hypothetical protein
MINFQMTKIHSQDLQNKAQKYKYKQLLTLNRIWKMLGRSIIKV